MQNYKRPILLVIAILTIASVTVLVTLGSSGQNSATSTKEEPTLIQEGVMSDRQKAHSKLFKHNGPKLKDVATCQKGDVEVEEGSPFVISLPQSGQQIPILQSAVCNADAIIVGVLKDKSSQLTEEENFIFTDHNVAVEDILKNNGSVPILLNGSIIVTRDGGAVQINGKTFRAKREDFKDTSIGKRYLLLLHFIPTTGSYLAYGSGSFELEGDRIIPLNEHTRHQLMKDETTTSVFLNEIRNYAATGCESKQK